MKNQLFHKGDRVQVVRIDTKYHDQLDPYNTELMKKLVGKVGILREGEYNSERGKMDVFLVRFRPGNITHSLDFLRKELRKV